MMKTTMNACHHQLNRDLITERQQQRLLDYDQAIRMNSTGGTRGKQNNTVCKPLIKKEKFSNII